MAPLNPLQTRHNLTEPTSPGALASSPTLPRPSLHPLTSPVRVLLERRPPAFLAVLPPLRARSDLPLLPPPLALQGLSRLLQLRPALRSRQLPRLALLPPLPPPTVADVSQPRVSHTPSELSPPLVSLLLLKRVCFPYLSHSHEHVRLVMSFVRTFLPYYSPFILFLWSALLLCSSSDLHTIHTMHDLCSLFTNGIHGFLAH